MKDPKFSQKIPWSLILIFLLLSLGITLAGYLYYIEQKGHFKREKGEELSAIADLKVNQIINWRRERMGDAALVLGNSTIGRRVQRFLSGDSNPEIKEEIQAWISSLQHNQYDNILLLDLKGRVRYFVPKKEKEIGPDARQLTLEAVKTKKAILSDLYQSKISEALRLSLLVPILNREGSTLQPVGVLLLRIDPYRFLYPFIRSWPTASRTGESILFCRQGEEFVFLNELRHYRESALSFRLSTGDRRSSGLWAVYQGRGVVEDLDYGGKPVLLAGRSIPDSPWFLITKEDAEEVYAPLKERAWMVALLIILMILAAGVSLGLIWRHQRSVYYRNQYQGELERQALTQHYLYLTKYANDIILLTDQDHQIIEVNDRALSAYGYSKEEFLGLKAKEMRSLNSKLLYEQQLEQFEDHKGMIYETIHRRKDGTEFPVEISFRSMDIEGVKYHQAIIRDITERKKAESALANEKERLAVTLRSIGDGVITTDLKGNIVLINRIAEELTGWSQKETAGRPLEECFYIINERTRERRENPVEKVIKTGGIVELANGTVLISKDQRERIIADSGAPIRDQKGEILGVVLVFRDITEKIKLEEELAKAEK
ncbi:MAG: PAS domain S-box protein, partial [Deltaproteobacteria bacterium]|nr:PAS domain S-box protein [Deltaproteobacteria bacterium]